MFEPFEEPPFPDDDSLDAVFPELLDMEFRDVLDADVAADSVAAWAASAPAWEGLATPFGELDPDRLSRAGRVDALMALERLRHWVDFQQQRLLAALHEDPVPGDPVQAAGEKNWVREEVACALRVSGGVAADRLLTAAELVRRRPATLGLLREGAVSLLHARALADAVRPLDAAAAAAVEAAVLPRAGTETVGQFRRTVTRAVQQADPGGVEERHARARDERRVALSPQPDGMAELWALLPAEQGLAAWVAIDQAARVGAADGRTLEQRRADSLLELLTGSVTVPAQVQVVVALSTLTGCDDQPGELSGHGPIPAGLARLLAFEPGSTWRRLVTDPLGQLVDCGRRRYQPPPPLAEFVINRDGTCRFPGCTKPACRCEIDHCRAWADGGTTCAGNLHSLCCRHHHLKHETGWQVERLDNGTTSWAAPTGHVYAKAPDDLPVDQTATVPTDPDPPPF